MRLLPLLLCLGLAGCVTDAAGDRVVGGPPASQPAAAQAPAPAAAPKPAAAAKKDDKKDEWWKEGGVTKERVSGMCWMKYEQGRKDLPVEKRADLVNKCVADTLKEHPLTPSPVSTMR